MFFAEVVTDFPIALYQVGDFGVLEWVEAQDYEQSCSRSAG
jgi:hypothetical protein